MAPSTFNPNPRCTSMKCWIIEQGEYSDYRVVGIFSTEENAKKAASSFTDEYDTPTIVERLLDPGIAELNEGLLLFSAFLNGEDWSIRKISFSRDPQDEERHYTPNAHYKNPRHSYILWARDASHALKIASERHTQWLASEAGIA